MYGSNSLEMRLPPFCIFDSGCQSGEGKVKQDTWGSDLGSVGGIYEYTQKRGLHLSSTGFPQRQSKHGCPSQITVILNPSYVVYFVSESEVDWAVFFPPVYGCPYRDRREKGKGLNVSFIMYCYALVNGLFSQLFSKSRSLLFVGIC